MPIFTAQHIMYGHTRFAPVPRQQTPQLNMASHYTPSNIIITFPPCTRLLEHK